MNKVTYQIKGMHCKSCEILIEEHLRELPGVKNAHVSLKNREATIYAEQIPKLELVKEALVKGGYSIGVDDEKDLLTKDRNVYQDIAISAIVLIGLYLWAKILGFDKIATSVTGDPTSLGVVFLVGLTAGLSTCMALIGGLVLSISAKHAEKHPDATSSQKFRPHLFFNIGRIVSYFVLGGVIGLLGNAFQLSGGLLGFLTIAVGFIMLVIGLQLTDLFPRLSNFKITLPASIGKFVGADRKHKNEYSHTNSMMVGALTFFLPCGFTQAMQLFAMGSGSFLSGALIMGIFALGTAPGLLGVGGITSIIKGGATKFFFRTVGLLVVGLALVNISTGLTLGGWKGSLFNFSNVNSSENIVSAGEVQVLNTTFVSNIDDIVPSEFTVNANQPVKFVVDVKENGVGCMSTIMIPGLANKPVYLKKGKQIVFEFTPKKSGTYEIACAMGVPRGKIIVK